MYLENSTRRGTIGYYGGTVTKDIKEEWGQIAYWRGYLGYWRGL